MNKSSIANLVALLVFLAGYFSENPILTQVGLFAFSGAITNWLAVHMLFERVPGIYGSGVIPARFEEIKIAIKSLMMNEFFNEDNIDRFLTSESAIPDLHLEPVIEKVDFGPVYDQLCQVIMQSSFGGMLNMFGGEAALEPLKDPFIKQIKQSLIDLSHDPEFAELLKEELEQPQVLSDIKEKVGTIIESRLNELTPQMVKQMVQEMIKKHLGWLVVWGGIFGGLIGLLSSLFIN